MGEVGNDKAYRLANRVTKGMRATRCSIDLPECYREMLLKKCLEKMALKNWQEKQGMVELREFNRTVVYTCGWLADGALER